MAVHQHHLAVVRQLTVAGEDARRGRVVPAVRADGQGPVFAAGALLAGGCIIFQCQQPAVLKGNQFYRARG